ncbi:MAG: phage shock protein operon transcriptional activator [Candidatus Latescibacterota bacterium]|nr:MAG: phage shock protein operon transcriptional activator [Candidatus Latescibacterota bacterium]
MEAPITAERYHAIGESDAFLALQERISQAAAVERSVILMGERGTGKELAAARLHLLSPRWNRPYVTLNCSSLAPSLIESELFGHEAGAFTGAMRQRQGRFEIADGGSLFLDEVADIPRPAQEKILRVVEYGRFERVGGSRTIDTDVRLIAATNKDLRQLAREGRFRNDLLDRLSFEVITLPPLRARRDDILLLAGHFARRMAAELGLHAAPHFSSRAEATLLGHDWPGNVRELKNVTERMVYRCAGETIDEVVLDPFESPHRPRPLPQTQAKSAHPVKSPAKPSAPFDDLVHLPLEQAVVELRVRRMRRALEHTRFNQREAARVLGLTYHQFRGYYRKYEKRLSERGERRNTRP